MQQLGVSVMTGKLEDLYSLSTSVLMNPICQFRAKDEDSICKYCFAASTASRYSGLALMLETNTIILTKFLIPESVWGTLVWPTTNGDARMESFGDVMNVTQARNYLRIMRSHSWLHFAVWSKNEGIWYAAFKKEGGKPKNMKFIVSSPKLNVRVELPAYIIPYVDHVFTVYTKEYAEANGIEINCGGRKCITCRNCYKCGTAFYINELKK